MDTVDENALDNPVWASLRVRHAALALGNEHAVRYRPEYSVLAGVRSVAPECVAALAPLYAPDETLVMGGAVVPELSAHWAVLQAGRLTQMVCRRPPPPAPHDLAIVPLTLADAPEMLALVELTRPGPFRPNTVELGNYVGIREHGRLIAMTGERLWIGQFREVSAVCTHPEARGRGLARTLMRRVMEGMLAAGLTPILHVETINTGAIALYRSLGFVERGEYPMLQAKRLPVDS